MGMWYPLTISATTQSNMLLQFPLHHILGWEHLRRLRDCVIHILSIVWLRRNWRWGTHTHTITGSMSGLVGCASCCFCWVYILWFRWLEKGRGLAMIRKGTKGAVLLGSGRVCRPQLYWKQNPPFLASRCALVASDQVPPFWLPVSQINVYLLLHALLSHRAGDLHPLFEPYKVQTEPDLGLAMHGHHGWMGWHEDGSSTRGYHEKEARSLEIPDR